MTLLHPTLRIQSRIRSTFETFRTLGDLYDDVEAILSTLEPAHRAELSAAGGTAQLRAQLGESLPRPTGPFVDLPYRRALVAVLEQCSTEEDAHHLCLAVLAHIRTEVESYRDAVEADPDHRRHAATPPPPAAPTGGDLRLVSIAGRASGAPGAPRRRGPLTGQSPDER